MTTFVQTDYRGTGAGDLLTYISREGDLPVRDRAGRELTDTRETRFLEKSERHQFNRHLIISPENGNDLTARELGRETRHTLEDFTEGRPSATYTYTVHQDTEHPHVHVAMTGEKTDLYMDTDDIERVRSHANERMVTNDRYRHRSHENDPQHERETAQQRAALEEELHR